MPTHLGARIAIHPVSYETLDWRISAPEMYSRAELKRQSGPYQAATPSPIAHWSPIVGSLDSADVEDAMNALTSFDHHAAIHLGRENPALGPMSAILLRTESASSSQIEQLTTTAKQLALAELGESDKANALSVMGNVRAMEASLKLSQHLDSASVLAMHRELMLHQLGFPADDAGRYRTQQVWIGPGTAGPRTADFVPPHQSRVQVCMDDLMRFIDRDDLPVLLQVAVAHAQFETIHPFPDGNGRTGRALAQAILRHHGVIKATTIPISAGLLTRTDQYFAALAAFREGDAGPIVREFAGAARLAAASGTLLVDQLVEQLEDSRRRLAGIRSDAAAWSLLPELVGQPAVNTRYLVEHLGMGEMAALRTLTTLTQRGVLVETTGRSRNRVWEHRGIFKVLDGYASNIRRASAAS